MVRKSLAAGILIALGGWIYLSVPDKIIGAFLFSIGLLTIRIFKLDLFTGKTQFLFTPQISICQLIVILINNIMGTIIIAILFYLLKFDNANVVALSQAKMALPWYSLLISGCACGALMTIATRAESPLWLSIMCVMAFILAGFEHCIADSFYFFAAGLNMPFLWQFWIIVGGNLIGGLLMALLLKRNPTS